jgi:hypothetical protein
MHGISHLQIKRRGYRAVLKNMHNSTSPQEIETEIENLGHMVTNIWNIKQFRPNITTLDVFCRTETCPE